MNQNRLPRSLWIGVLFFSSLGLLHGQDCTNPTACNYDPSAPILPGSENGCIFSEDGYDCEGDCLNDSDSDGVCDPFEIIGCTDADALNFNPEATEDNGYCAFLEDLTCSDESACNFQPYQGSGHCIQIEPYVEHAGMVGTDDLTGYTTFRIYALCPNEDDFISSVSGDSEFPTAFSSSGDVFQSPFGGALGSDQAPLLFAFMPSAEFDSFITIGLTESAASGEGIINTLGSDENPWVNNFESNGHITIDDEIGGGWYILNGQTNGIASTPVINAGHVIKTRRAIIVRS